jgi:hypothetical protein
MGGRMTTKAAVLVAIGVRAAVTLAVAAHAAGTSPAITGIAGDRSQLTVDFVGHDKTGSYGIEVSRQNVLRADGHFALSFLRRQGVPLRVDQTQTLYLHLRPGRYCVRVFDDYTAAYLAYLSGLSTITGTIPTWDGKTRKLSWSRTWRVDVR